MDGVSSQPMRKIQMIRTPDPKVVERFEKRNFKFIIGGNLPVCVDCGPTENEGFTRHDGAFLCLECLSKRSTPEPQEHNILIERWE